MADIIPLDPKRIDKKRLVKRHDTDSRGLVEKTDAPIARLDRRDQELKRILWQERHID